MSLLTSLLISLLSTSVATRTGTDAPCNSLTGVWNAQPGHNSNLVRIIDNQNNSRVLTGAWWLPNPTTNVSGSITGRELVLGSLEAVVSASPYMAKDKSGPAPPCSFFTFTHDHNFTWCLEPWCPTGPAPGPPSPPPPPTPNDPETQMPNFVVPNAAEQGAFYPNGAPANFFMNRTEGETGWVIHLSGGGWRFAPMDQTPTYLSHKQDNYFVRDGVPDPEQTLGHCYGKCDGILSNNADVNPLFHSWNKVWIPITGTSFTGDVDKGPPYVRGKRVQMAVIQDLLDNYGMSKATNVILTGGSSGGLATYLTCDRVGEQIRAVNPSVRYTCLPDAGYFLHHNDMNGGNSTSMNFKHSYYAWNSSSGTNQACVEDKKPSGEDWKCIFAQYVAPYIKSEMFVMQNLYDSWQVNNILKIGCSGYNKPMTSCSAAQMAALEQYGADMRSALAPVTSNPNIGMFAPSCIAHCQSVQNEHDIALWYWPGRWSIVDGTDTVFPMTAFNAWYSNTAKGNSSKHVQQCAWNPDNCNTLCPDWT